METSTLHSQGETELKGEKKRKKKWTCDPCVYFCLYVCWEDDVEWVCVKGLVVIIYLLRFSLRSLSLRSLLRLLLRLSSRS